MTVGKPSDTPADLEQALQLFGLTRPFTRERLNERRQALLTTWHPHRYANLTNNPRKYMQMYKKAEAMTKEIMAASELLLAWLDRQEEMNASAQDTRTFDQTGDPQRKA